MPGLSTRPGSVAGCRFLEPGASLQTARVRDQGGDLEDLAKLPNIGPVLAAELRKAGITTYEALADLGSVKATLRIARGSKVVRYNLLYALEGAIRGVRWHSIPAQERARLRQELERSGKR